MGTDDPATQSVGDLRSHAERGNGERGARGNEERGARGNEERSATWPLLVLVLVAAAVLLVIQWRRPRALDPLVGLPLPPLEAAGWINSDSPLSTDDLRGEVVLLDFWMTTCGPCIRAMPELAQLHEQFHDQGLKVIGLTPESNDTGHVSEFVEHIPGLAWPVAYGAGYTFEMTGIEATPTYVLYDRTGRSVWAGHWLDGAEDAVVAALAK